MSHTIAEQERLLRAALRILSNEREEEHAHSGDESWYSSELLAIAARDLVRAVDALPEDQRPVGWGEGKVIEPDPIPTEVLRVKGMTLFLPPEDSWVQAEVIDYSHSHPYEISPAHSCFTEACDVVIPPVLRRKSPG